MKVHASVLALLTGSLGFLAACGAQQPSASKLDGHYESTSATAMLDFQGQQTAMAEFSPSRGVIISLPLLQDFGKYQMAADIVAAGIDTLWITVPSTYTGSLASREFASLRTLLGADASKVKLVRQVEDGPVTVWARDWSPLGARTDSGELRLLDFNYYNERVADDSTARSLLPILPVDRVSVPVYNEGGNFMNNSRGDCMMTTRVSDANAFKERSDDLVLSNSQIQSYYKTFAGCRTVSIFPRIPYEGTGHIDMWAKFLDDDNVIVGELRDEIVNLPGYSSSQRTKVQNMQSYLNARAAEISAKGFKVSRIPMPAPVFSASGDTFRSYTNSLTVNGDVLVPRYVSPAYPDLSINGRYIDQALLARYEAEVVSMYESFGYRFKWVVSDDLIAQGGAVHCTTMQITR